MMGTKSNMEKKMTVALANTKNEIIADSSKEQLDMIKDMWFKGHGSDVDLGVFWHVCKHKKLDPFSRQIYPVFRNTKQKDGSKVEQMTIQTGIDGFRLIADRTGRYCAGREPTFQYDKNGSLVSATSYIKKQTQDGTWHEVSGVAFYSEYVQKNFDGSPSKFWAQMPHVMLAKCAETVALRKGFPEDLSGIYTNEEMGQADAIDITPAPQPINVKRIDIGTVQFISSEQVAELEALIAQIPEDARVKFSDWIKQRGFNSLGEISPHFFDEVKPKLRIKVAQLKQASAISGEKEEKNPDEQK